MELSNIPEAFKAGWSAFRATLFSPRRKSMTFIGEFPPSRAYRGDIWITPVDMDLRIHNGWRWKPLKEKKSIFKRYLTWLKK